RNHVRHSRDGGRLSRTGYVPKAPSKAKPILPWSGFVFLLALTTKGVLSQRWRFGVCYYHAFVIAWTMQSADNIGHYPAVPKREYLLPYNQGHGMESGECSVITSKTLRHTHNTPHSNVQPQSSASPARLRIKAAHAHVLVKVPSSLRISLKRLTQNCWIKGHQTEYVYSRVDMKTQRSYSHNDKQSWDAGLSYVLATITALLTLSATALGAPGKNREGHEGDRWKGDRKKAVGFPFFFTSTYRVIATPDQVVNGTTSTGGLPGAIGYYNLGINSLDDTICYHITLHGFRGDYQSPAKTATHIHEARRGQSGPPRLVFPNPEGDENVAVSLGCLKGPFTTGLNGPDGKDTGEGFTVRQIEEDPEAFFADVHSSLAVPGAVRGQNNTLLSKLRLPASPRGQPVNTNFVLTINRQHPSNRIRTFLDKLPNETRLQIYAEVFRSNYPRLEHNRAYGRHRNREDLLHTSLLRANHQVFAEALPILYETNNITVHPYDLCSHITTGSRLDACKAAFLRHAVVHPRPPHMIWAGGLKSCRCGTQELDDHVELIEHFGRAHFPRLRSVTFLVGPECTTMRSIQVSLTDAGMQASFSGVWRLQVASPDMVGTTFTFESKHIAASWDWAVALIRARPNLDPDEVLSEVQLHQLLNPSDAHTARSSNTLSVAAQLKSKKIGQRREAVDWESVILACNLRFEWLQQEEAWNSETFAMWTADSMADFE
ncbi:putative chrd superfamily protein, partial [Teratosphaeria destructans]